MRNLISYGMRALALALVVLFVAPLATVAVGGPLLAYTVLTNTDVNKIWRKSQGKLAKGYNFTTREFRWIREYKELEIDASLREMTFPVDLYEDRGIANILEGGKEAEPMSQNAEDATVAFCHANGRFTVAKLSKWASQADGGRGAIKKQLSFQALKKIEAMGRVLGDQFYGFSTGHLAQTSTNATQASGTYTLKNAFGSSTIAGSTTAQKNYIARLFKVGDRVALIRSDALVTNAIGVVTAVTAATPSIAVTWAGSVDSDDNDYVVLANATGGTTIAHTNYNKTLVGLLDMEISTSVHGISGSSVPNWTAAYADTAGGRFNGVRWRAAYDAIRNDGDEDAKVMTLMDQGVYRDTMAQYQTQLRFDDAFALEIDGDLKAGGQKPRTSKRVPPGYVQMFEKSVIRRKTIHDNVNEGDVVWNDGKELIDESGWVFGIDWAGFLATTNRKGHAYFSGLTQSN